MGQSYHQLSTFRQSMTNNNLGARGSRICSVPQNFQAGKVEILLSANTICRNTLTVEGRKIMSFSHIKVIREETRLLNSALKGRQ